MKLAKFDMGLGLTLTFAALLALILGGNALLIWQFRSARLQTERLTGVSQQMFEVLRLQPSVLVFHQQLDELLGSRHARHLVAQGGPLRRTLLQQTQRTRNALTQLPPEIRVDPTFRLTLETIELTLPEQLDTVTALAASGDWDAVRLRLRLQLNPIETETANLVESLDRDVSGELAQAVANMRNVQRRINIIVPATAICTFFIAAFFGRAVAQRYLAVQFSLRLEERVNERTRIARELHDTLLQTVQGLMLRLQAVSEILAPGKAKDELEQTLEIGDRAIIEGRRTVSDLRKLVNTKLPSALRALGDELACKGSATLRVVVEGPILDLHSILGDEIYCIAREALRNAFAYAQAKHIEAEITYGKWIFRLRIRDDGKGIPAEILNEGKVGHFGLAGMHERAKQIGSQLTISSGPEAGTEIELCVKGSLAYDRPSGTLGWRLFRRKIG